MTGDVEKKWERLRELQAELKRLQEELKQGLSRRNFLGRLKGAGVGFGAAFVLGVNKAAALNELDPNVSVDSTNPAVAEILAEGAKEKLIEGAKDPGGKVDPADPMTHMAYRRFFRRWYRRGYRRFFYRRFYRRGYRRFFYRRWYRRW